MDMKILIEIFFSLKKDNRIRGHEVTVVKDQCRLDIMKYSLSQRTINEWNKLSTHCKTASSVNKFKNKVDTYLRRHFWTLDNAICSFAFDDNLVKYELCSGYCVYPKKLIYGCISG